MKVRHAMSMLVLGLSLAGVPEPATAAAAAPKASRNVETRINADKMMYYADKQQVVFETGVHVRRPDFELRADRLVVHMKAPRKDAGTVQGKRGLPEGMAAGDVDRLVAERNVRMTSEGRTGTCSRAVYTVDDGVLRMEGNPRVSDGENTITGEVIRYFTKENRSEVVGSAKKRVEAVFSSPSKPAPEGGRR